MRLPEHLIDNVGRAYPRKNLYLRDLETLLREGKTQEANALKSKRDAHPHIQQLARFRAEEKSFLETLKSQAQTYSQQLQESDKKIEEWKTNLFLAEQKLAFYEKFVDLDYDAELEYRTAEKEIEQYPRIIDEYETIKKDLAWAEEDRKKIDPKEESDFQKSLEKFRSDAKLAMEVTKKELKASYQEGNISKKAYTNGVEMAVKKFKYDSQIAAYKAPVAYNEDLQRNLKHRLKYGTRDNLITLHEEISNVRRTTPIEVEKSESWKPLVSLPIPGVGQLLNGQYTKAIFFFLASLFIFLIAIPYALGFGNYQGTGVSGLITLAQGGKRTDRSLIFMIEGIIAVMFLFITVLLLYLSYRDVKKVVKDKHLGIRPKNWFETKDNIGKNGFPFFANVPAYIMIMFITLVPVITAILLSFTGMDPQHQSKFSWIGLDNYLTIFTGSGLQGSLFWSILQWTIVWTIGATTLAIAIGFFLALLSNNERVKGKRFFRTVYILPWAVPAFITIMFFSVLLAPQGYLTNLISGIAGQTVNVKDSTTLTRLALILIQGWCGSAYVFLLSTGVLQSIPSDLYEAAEMDGASSMQRLLKITIPMVLFQTAPILVGQYTFNFNNYTIIELFNGGGPFNPLVYGNLAGSSDLLISYIYKLTMNNQFQALGAAISIVISIGLIIISYIGYRRTATFKEG